MERLTRALLLPVLLWTVAASPAAAARWTLATPLGGSILTLAQAPASPQTLYAAASHGRVFLSLDAGATWSFRGELPLGAEIVDLLVDTEKPRTVYARTSTLALWRSRNGGRNWTEITPESPSVFAAALDRGDSDTLYAGTAVGLFRSPNEGETWELVGFQGQNVVGFAIDPSSARFFAALAGGLSGDRTVIWKSADRGATWTETSLSLPLNSFRNVPHFAFDPTRPGTVYAFFTVAEGLGYAFRSVDGGTSWVQLPELFILRDLVAAPDGDLFATVDTGVIRSTDRGETWSPASPPDFIERLLVSTAPPGALFAAGHQGVWRSGNDGATWETANRGLVALGASSIAVAPSGPPAVVAVTADPLLDGIFRSSNRGETWTRVHSQDDGRQPFILEAFDPRRPRTIYGIGGDGQADSVLRTTNGGRDWTRLPVPFVCGGSSACDVTIRAFALHPDDPDTLFVAGSYFFHLAGQGDFLVRSDDGFQTTQYLKPVPGLQDLVIDPDRTSTFYGLTCDGHLFKSLNAGRMWRQTGRGLPGYTCVSKAEGPRLVLDPRDSRRLYAGSGNRGVYVSTDGGATFQPMNRGLGNAHVATLLIDPSDSDLLYAAVPGRGVFQWDADLGRWTLLSQGLPAAHFNGVLALDPRNPSILYAGTDDRGIFRLDLEE